MHWLIHILGIDTQHSWPYDFWSGIATQLGLILGGIGLLIHHNCHQHGCLRIGRYAVAGGKYKVCRKHHPDPDVRNGLSSEHLLMEHVRHAASIPEV